jgi:hypothetical protein
LAFAAFASWLLVANSGDQAVGPGTVIVVTEGARPVALFRVDYVRADPLPSALRSLDLESLLGCTEEDARRRVETAGGSFAPMRAKTRGSRWT